MTIESVTEAARVFVTETFLYTAPDARLLPDESLLDQGIIDSMGVMELVEWIGSTYGVDVADGDITEENLGTLASIARYVVGKTGGSHGDTEAPRVEAPALLQLAP